MVVASLTLHGVGMLTLRVVACSSVDVLSALLSASASLLLLSLLVTNIPYIQGTVPYT